MELSNPVKYTIIGCCMGLAALILGWQFWPAGGGGGEDVDIVMLCTNAKCDKAYKLKPAEFQEMMSKQGGMDPMMMMGGMSASFECKFCKQKTASIAYECPKCKSVFVQPNPMMGGMSNDYPDRCPDCKFSQIEEDMKTQK
ncbi:MAG: hypothetical protein A2178_03400 [Planctomycetes bacterium GWC2_49_10]|nr:MAG: hypothetical protein A2178_03400 [Planctomycetes bacterium GWC2_49_10]